jgi:hypothetical protein
MPSAAARRLHREDRHVCLACRAHRARFQYRGEVRADRRHTLCFRCFRAEVQRERARRLAEVSTPPPLKMDLARPVKRGQARDLFARA